MSNKRGYPFFIEQLRLITATTEALNNLGKSGALEDEHHYLNVEMRNPQGDIIGVWLDEHDGTAWEFAPIERQQP